MFSLGRKIEDQANTGTTSNSKGSSLLLFGNEEIYEKGFELWQQYYQSHKSIGRGGGGAGEVGVGIGVGGMNCQDCGNKAKKDCPHMRCRTCCKSRGFHCQTHIKSTWVPAAARRERQQHQTTAVVHHSHQHHHHQQQQQQLGLLRENPKRPRQASGLQVGHNFPPEVNSPAVFRCVKVSTLDDPDEQYAYQTAVNIGGHMFKGILYDQGPENRYGGGESSSGGGGGGGSQPQLNLLAAAATASTMAASTAATSGYPAVTMFDPSMYPAPLSAFMAGTQFFPPPRP